MTVYETLLRVYGAAVADSFRHSSGDLRSAIGAITRPDHHTAHLLEGKTFNGYLDREIIRFDASRTDPTNSLI
ncbi:hypothetical protein KA107_00825 [Candidatus Pacearchaeota archaeon]|nr:hypothetical protein [Candidatus Pacearchaeota archaeon]